MKARLARVLERGGMASQLSAERWGIWRGRDRRTRRIGVLSGAEIDVLRLRGMLQPWGDGAPPILVCAQSILEPSMVAPSPERLDQEAKSVSRPLIELMVDRCHDRALRQLICDTVHRYRTDVDCAARAGITGHMNWDGLALGGRIEGGRGPQAPNPAFRASRAQAALAVIEAALGVSNMRLLDRLILGEETRAALARRFAIRPSLMEGRALAAIRALHQVYGVKIKPPD